MKNLLEYKGLIYELAARDLKMRYRKPFLGFFWMLIMPFSTAFIYKVLFSDFMHVASGKYPFFIYLITAFLPWGYFATAIQGSSGCILSSRNIINQISFPKYLIPVSTVFANLVNFLPAMIILLGFIVAFNIKISLLILLLPAVIAIHTCLIIGLSLLVSSLQVIYRDTEYILQVMIMTLFFLTPGVYTLEEVIAKSPPFIAKAYMFNPLVGLTNLYRIVLMGGYLEDMPREINFLNMVIVPVLFSISMLFAGYFIFKKYENRFSDYLNV
jgi:lipopolysaccharide transport system permease protein